MVYDQDSISCSNYNELLPKLDVNFQISLVFYVYYLCYDLGIE